eukprot:2197230-Rhodomonas_salina.1
MSDTLAEGASAGSGREGGAVPSMLLLLEHCAEFEGDLVDRPQLSGSTRPYAITGQCIARA